MHDQRILVIRALSAFVGAGGLAVLANSSSSVHHDECGELRLILSKLFVCYDRAVHQLNWTKTKNLGAEDMDFTLVFINGNNKHFDDRAYRRRHACVAMAVVSGSTCGVRPAQLVAKRRQQQQQQQWWYWQQWGSVC